MVTFVRRCFRDACRVLICLLLFIFTNFVVNRTDEVEYRNAIDYCIKWHTINLTSSGYLGCQVDTLSTGLHV